MDVIQSVSEPKAPPAGSTAPAFANREIQSRVAVPNGETIALGGLIRDTSSETKDGIPFLSYIPVLGWLFSTNSEQKIRTELVVLITPRTVEQKGDITRVTNEFRSRIKGFGNLKAPPGSEESLPGGY